MSCQTCDKTARRFMSAFLLLLGSLAPSCRCAPSIPIQSEATEWRKNVAGNGVPRTIFTPSCDPTTGRCWDLLSPVADPRNNYVVEPDEFYDRAQPIHARAIEQTTDTWLKPMSGYAKESSPRNPANGRHAKKDMFMSRGWGAGGMPFSVLYMKPRAGNHPPSSGSSILDGPKTLASTRRNGADSSLSSTPPNPVINNNNNNNNNNNRVAQRNSSYGSQSRRHYSIIPQLFISYGWGPSGK